ncbi:hypothetical protein FRB93_004463 [Tulasnella sp. JGI-2019a]|nr:hypothetical protein FRB93_004463 [Tulasnella sp. JGI-2019a]
MEDYMIQALNIFSEGAARTARSQLPTIDSELTELQSSKIVIRSFDDALKTFCNNLHRLRSAKARHHNTLLPISRLPNDLLVNIFASVFETKDPFMGSVYGGRSVVGMLATLVFVCHEWREIMHSVPSLWTYLNSEHPHEANLECLARSGQAPLHISYSHNDLPTELSEKFVTTIFQEVHPWKSVRFHDTTCERLEELEQRPAPFLEKLFIRVDWASHTTLNLFRGSASRLRQLILFNVTFPWESNLFSGLRTLHIAHPREGRPSVQQVMHILRSCPNLTNFTLCLELKGYPDDLVPPYFALEPPRFEHLSMDVDPLMTEHLLGVELLQLKHLNMDVHPLMTEHLLQQMCIPSCKTFNIHQAGTNFSAAMDHLIPTLSSIFLSASRVCIDITPTTIKYETTTEINETEEVDSDLAQKIRIKASNDRFVDRSAMETLSWLVDNIHTPSFYSPVVLTIFEPHSLNAISPTIYQLSSAITELHFSQVDLSSVKIIASYLAEPFEVIVDGVIVLR